MSSYGNDGPGPGAGKSAGSPLTGAAAAERAVRDLRAAGRMAEAGRIDAKRHR